MKRWLKIAFVVSGVAIFFVVGIIIHVQTYYADKIIYDIGELEKAPVALILGAGIISPQTPSDALRDRLLVGVTLFEQGKAESLLITGDDGNFRRAEIPVMKNFLLAHNIPPEHIQEDGQGYRTYESCKRAVEQGIRKAIIVTQRFHLSRALYLCNTLGMDAQGVPADLTTYRRIVYFTLRDLAASFKAWLDIHVITPASPV